MSSDSPSTPYKAPSVAETRRNQLALPLLVIPPAISAYFAFLSPNAKGLTWFALHPLLMMVGFFTLGGLSTLTKKVGGKANTELHGTLMFLSSLVAGFATYVIYSQKEMMGKAHLTTPHAQFGALTLLLFLGYPVGAYVLYNPDSGLLRANLLARKLHKYSGRVILACGIVTCCFGITSMEKDPVMAGGMIASLLACTPFFLL